MNDCREDTICVRKTLEKILDAQKKVKKHECDRCITSCENSIDELLNPECKHSKNTIPFILYCGCEAFKVDGVTTCIDPHKKKEKFVCFTTFIFRIKDLKGDCVVLELLKFENHDTCSTNNNHVCTPCCQLDCEDVDDLISTCVCVTMDLSCFCGIQCLPAVCL